MIDPAAFVDLDSTITFALMRNHFDGDLTTVIAVDRLVTEEFPSDHHRLPDPTGVIMNDPRVRFDGRFSDPEAEATPCSATREVLESAQLSWLTTVRADGRPHVTPLVTVWVDGALHFCTGPGEQKALNLTGQPRVAVTTGCNTWSAGLDVVVEGSASRVHRSTDAGTPGGRLVDPLER